MKIIYLPQVQRIREIWVENLKGLLPGVSGAGNGEARRCMPGKVGHYRLVERNLHHILFQALNISSLALFHAADATRRPSTSQIEPMWR